MADGGAKRSDQSFDALITPATSTADAEPERRVPVAVSSALTWGAAALVALLAALGGLFVSVGISEARSFGWPTSTPTDLTAQMNLDEALLALPVGGTLTGLLVVVYIASMIYIARDRGPGAWIAPSALVVAAATAPIAWAFTL